MLSIGPIRKIFSGTRLLLFAYVDDNSSLKSQFVCLIKPYAAGGFVIGKGYADATDSYPRLVVNGWKVGSWYGAPVVIGIGRWREVEY